ncbi:DNA-binding protein [Amycolatopsis sp. WAC 04182]|uniref:DNA-binding protein n=1 Tax=Amycolatopsis sp. WAC 04182 TaxID=2203198 RepID=UPI000F79A331|nr:DNA-binding protein [Amycolatopsis sp. WAC 04182]RSN55424.1 DNA-binding protein [Amycolatopsis sp. WAC 04182]
MNDQTDLPPGIGNPATRAFTAAGYTRLEHFTHATEAELASLHGVGPKALRIIREALETRGQTFKRTD